MFPRGGFDAKASRRKLLGTEATPDTIARLVHADIAKALVMKFISQLVADGFAQRETLDNGEIELRVNTSETFILGEKAIVRLA